jgi:hypothetical protein
MKKSRFMPKFPLIVLGSGAILSHALPAIADSVCVDLTPPAGIPIVKNQADLQRWTGQQVMLSGRYQRVSSGPPLRMSPLEGLTSPNSSLPAQSPPLPGRSGFANIAVNDGWVVIISPKGKHGLRTASELNKYDTQLVQIQGRARWWGGTSPRSAAGIDIYLLRRACPPTSPPVSSVPVTPLPVPPTQTLNVPTDNNLPQTD